MRNQYITSVQFINEEGEKKFLTGSHPARGCYILGSGYPQYICEGYATGLSIHKALLSKPHSVKIAFNAQNIPKVAIRNSHSYIIADNDKSRTGERYAKMTGLPYWMPPAIDTDANDFHVEHGLGTLLNELLSIVDN